MAAEHPTLASRAASVSTLAVGLVLVLTMVEGQQSAVLVLTGVGVVVSVAVGVALWLANTFEARLLATVLSAVVVLITVLGLTVGLPGEQARDDLTASSVLLLGSCALTWILVAVDARTRARRRESARRPYAL
ncbi:hypothetical protein [Nocardioides campestrisoli]|uniref:hypothetical protein n=1 Tax=Nocardioides campestrisoli TaxID=2736757 RepID=UPI0015E6B7C7|nr:hypothetical protein [Nocardioides campestrisoli]